MYDNLTQETQQSGLTKAAYKEMYSGNMVKRTGHFQDCNNGQPINNIHKHKRVNQFRHCISADNFYVSNHPKSDVSGDTQHSRKRRLSDGSRHAMTSVQADIQPVEMESYNYFLPLTQSFELMSHIPSILDDLKQELEALEIENSASTISGSSSVSAFVQKPANFTQDLHNDHDIGTIKIEHLKLYNDMTRSDSKSGNAYRDCKHVPNSIEWKHATARPSKANNSQLTVKAYHQSMLAGQDEQYLLNQHLSPKTLQTNGCFFDNGYESPAEASQNIDALIRMQQQIAPIAVSVPRRFENLGGETINEDNLFDGCCEKELLIDLFKELTDDLKQANAEHTLSITGFEDINMDKFTDLVCRSASTGCYQEAGKHRNKAISSARQLRQKLPSFTSAFC